MTSDRQMGRVRLALRAPDARALAALAVIVALVSWNRLVFDAWVARYDIATYNLPWFAHLGTRLRELDVPGWTPHQFSGMPFAGDPQSGWAYFPAMVAFVALPPIAAFKAMVAFHLTVAAFSTYGLARALRIGPIGALLAAILYLTGPFLQWSTYCCLPFGMLGAWTPLAMLGIELSLRATSWRERMAPWLLSGVALSQIFAGWVGEGWLYGLLLMGLYTAVRALGGRGLPVRAIGQRVLVGAATGAATVAWGAAFGAAGILPRLDVTEETVLRGGNYDGLGERGAGNPPWDLDYLLVMLSGMGEGYHSRATGIGGVAIVLALLAPFVAFRRPAVLLLTVVTAAAFVLTLDTTPLHDLAYLIPRYEAIHEHDPWRVIAFAAIGPPLLAATTLDAMRRLRGRWYLLPLVLIPIGLLIALPISAELLKDADGVRYWPPLVEAGVATLIVAAVVVIGRPSDAGSSSPVVRWGLVLLVVAAFVQPTGLELTGSWLGWPEDERWERFWEPNPPLDEPLETELATTEPLGAGGFLQARLEEEGPFRYVGYGGIGHPEGGRYSRLYQTRRFEPSIQAILVNGRQLSLDLYDIQGYTPSQLSRYAELVRAVNGGRTQGYHHAFLLPEGVRSPLLDLLDVRYVLVDATLPPDRPDVVAITAGRPIVFQTNLVRVYEVTPAPVHAWIVHDVRQVRRGEALPAMVNGETDLRRTAFVEGDLPDVAQPADPQAESVTVVSFEDDALTIRATVTAPGLLVLSEIYADGWRATINGEPVEILPTNHALRGIPVPAGEHTIRLEYAPRSLTAGLWISAAAIVLALAVLMWLPLDRRRRRGDGSGAR